ncbi:unnamed protein product [Diamesa serratosioi]
MNPNEAAIKAIHMFSDDKHLLEENICSKKVNEPKVLNSPSSSSVFFANLSDAVPLPRSSTNPELAHSIKPSSSNLMKSPINEEVHYLDEEKLLEIMDSCEKSENNSLLIRTLGIIFSNADYVSKSFQKRPKSSVDEMLDRVPSPTDLKWTKEDLRTLEGEKDEDSMESKEDEKVIDLAYTTIDFISLRRSMKHLYDTNIIAFEKLDNVICNLLSCLCVDLRIISQKEHIEEFITVVLIIFEIFQIGPVPLENSIANMIPAVCYLPLWAQERLAHIWSVHCKTGLNEILQILQQVITLQIITNGIEHGIATVNDNEVITNATKCMRVVFWANLLASRDPEMPKFYHDERSPSPSSVTDEQDDYTFDYQYNPKSIALDDPLTKTLSNLIAEIRSPIIPFEEFYNESLCDAIQMDKDYLCYRRYVSGERNIAIGSIGSKFTFMMYSFILTTSTKTMALFFDSRIKMFSERHDSLNMHYGSVPYLKLKVRRDYLIDDALAELEMVAMTNPKQLRKQLVVEFEGEQGIDEGGVSKEFFQLIVEEIFNPDYGMFVNMDDTQMMWFNSLSFENDAQFTLIGIVLGLAIYNSIILPVSFPMVVYRKLLNTQMSFIDLKEWNPVLFNSLYSMIQYQDNDFEETFEQTFEIGYQDVFGETLKHCLKENGDKIKVNQHTKYEFVELYADFLLNTSIEKQFKAFKKGFQMVTDESPLSLLFRPEEIELLVCGSKNFDFEELEKSTEYEAGYLPESDYIKQFWIIVHGLPLESKQKLLQFTTGSDRIPVGGLSKLKLVIARNGPDCDRLPTAHTCFNILLLPEYNSKEKLEERLLKAINYSKGFGML